MLPFLPASCLTTHIFNRRTRDPLGGPREYLPQRPVFQRSFFFPPPVLVFDSKMPSRKDRRLLVSCKSRPFVFFFFCYPPVAPGGPFHPVRVSRFFPSSGPFFLPLPSRDQLSFFLDHSLSSVVHIPLMWQAGNLSSPHHFPYLPRGRVTAFSHPSSFETPENTLPTRKKVPRCLPRILIGDPESRLESANRLRLAQLDLYPLPRSMYSLWRRVPAVVCPLFESSAFSHFVR